MPPGSGSVRNRVQALLLVLGASAIAYLVLVSLRRYVGVVFCAVLLATALGALARLIDRRSRMPRPAAVGVVLLLLLGLQTAFLALVGPALFEQFSQLTEQVPRGFASARESLEASPLGRKLLDAVPPLSELAPSAARVIASVRSALGTGLAGVLDVLIVLALGIFFAVTPQRYLAIPVRLLPRRHRERAWAVLHAMAQALRRWLVARLLLMLLIAVVLGIGLLLLGVELALPLAILAGALTFVPYIGPTLGLLPALAMALLESPMHVVYVGLLYLGVQLLESYLVEPLVEAEAISIPPAMILLAQVVTAMWLGALGVLLASPLLVVLVVAVQMLYVEDVLGDEVEVIGSGSG